MPIKFSADLLQLLTYSLYGLAWAMWGLGMYTVGWAVGKNRGFRQAPEKYKEELADEQQKRLVAEGRLEAEQRASRRIDSALNALTAQPEEAVERQGLKVTR